MSLFMSDRRLLTTAIKKRLENDLDFFLPVFSVIRYIYTLHKHMSHSSSKISLTPPKKSKKIME